MLRFETGLLGICSLLWLLVSLAFAGLVPLAGALELDLYRFFSFSGALGWLAGNVYVYRRQRLFGSAPTLLSRSVSANGAATPGDGAASGANTPHGDTPPSGSETGPARRRHRRRFLFVYLLGPPSLLYLLRVLSPTAAQEAAPFVPLYSLFVYGLFFLVPVTLKVGRTPLRG